MTSISWLVDNKWPIGTLNRLHSLNGLVKAW